jgi:hypothetical protein
MERYELVIPQPLQLQQRRDRRRRRPRSPASIERCLRAESETLFDAAVARGLVDSLEKQVLSVAEGPHGACDDSDGACDDSDGARGFRGEADAPVDEADAAECPGADGDEEETDKRTDAERKFAAAAEAREAERLARLAAVSYKEQVDRFNVGLASEPQHYDVFKTSHTKG